MPTSARNNQNTLRNNTVNTVGYLNKVDETRGRGSKATNTISLPTRTDPEASGDPQEGIVGQHQGKWKSLLGLGIYSNCMAKVQSSVFAQGRQRRRPSTHVIQTNQ